MKLVPIENYQAHFPQLDCWRGWGFFLAGGGGCFGATRRTSTHGCFSLPDPVSERRVGEQDSAPTQEKPTSPGRSTDKKAKDDGRRVAKSTQDLSDVSMDEVGIPLRVRVPPFRGLLSARDKCAPLHTCGPYLGLQRPRRRVLTTV